MVGFKAVFIVNAIPQTAPFIKVLKIKKKKYIDIYCYLCKPCLRNINKHSEVKEKYDKICNKMIKENKNLIMKYT